MTVQNIYQKGMDEGLAGGIYDLNYYDAVSRNSESITPIDFGLVVSEGVKDDTCKLGGTTPLGVSIRTLEKEGIANTGEIHYNFNETVGIMRKGYVWAICVNGCNKEDSVKYNVNTGMLYSGTPSAADETELKGTWEKSAGAGKLSILRINL